MSVALQCSNPQCGETIRHTGSWFDRPDRCAECGSDLEETDLGSSVITGHGRKFEVELPETFGRYRVMKRLGTGGMGSVFLVTDTALERLVALKVPHLDGPGAAEILGRFRREARSAAAIDHPNVCPIHDVGEIDGIPYMAMAYVEGQSLADRLKEVGHPSPREAVAWVGKLASALAVGHRRGIVHRDLKPANVMINRAGEPVILDFGIAHRVDDSDGVLTLTGAVVGTPQYMSPEQVEAQRDRIGPPTDIYSLGVILYELLAGRKPFEGPLTRVLVQIIMEEPKPLTDISPEVGPALAAVCRKAMAKRVEDRYPSMRDFAEALKRSLPEDRGGVSVDAGTIRSGEPAPVRDRDRPSGWKGTAPARRGRGGLVAALGLGMLGLVAVGAALKFEGDPRRALAWGDDVLRKAGLRGEMARPVLPPLPIEEAVTAKPPEPKVEPVPEVVVKVPEVAKPPETKPTPTTPVPVPEPESVVVKDKPVEPDPEPAPAVVSETVKRVTTSPAPEAKPAARVDPIYDIPRIDLDPVPVVSKPFQLDNVPPQGGSPGLHDPAAPPDAAMPPKRVEIARAPEPAPVPPPPPRPIAAGATPKGPRPITRPQPVGEFFGLSDSGDRVVYLIDASAAMTEGRALAKAHRELIHSLGQWPKGTWVGVFVFSDRSRKIAPVSGGTALHRLSPERVKAIDADLARVRPQGEGRLAPALKAALEGNPETLFVLASGGEITEEEVADLRSSLGRTRINLVRLVGAKENLAPHPLDRLANESGGEHRVLRRSTLPDRVAPAPKASGAAVKGGHGG